MITWLRNFIFDCSLMPSIASIISTKSKSLWSINQHKWPSKTKASCIFLNLQHFMVVHRPKYQNKIKSVIKLYMKCIKLANFTTSLWIFIVPDINGILNCEVWFVHMQEYQKLGIFYLKCVYKGSYGNCVSNAWGHNHLFIFKLLISLKKCNELLSMEN